MKLLYISKIFAISFLSVAFLISISIANVAAEEDLNETVRELNDKMDVLTEEIREIDNSTNEIVRGLNDDGAWLTKGIISLIVLVLILTNVAIVTITTRSLRQEINEVRKELQLIRVEGKTE